MSRYSCDRYGLDKSFIFVPTLQRFFNMDAHNDVLKKVQVTPFRRVHFFVVSIPFYFTPPKFNIDPEELPSKMGSSLPTTIFQGLC